MQIFQWLFKVTPGQAGESIPYHTNKKINYGKDAEAEDIILYNQRGVYRRRSKRVKESDHHHLGGKYLKPFAFFCRKDVAKACFCSTLSLRRIGSNNRRRWIHSMNKMKKEESARGLGSTHQKAHDSATAHAAGNKVLPLSDAATNNEQCGTVGENKKDKNDYKIVNKGDRKTKTMSSMKELLRWAGAAKSKKGGKFQGRMVLHFRNQEKLKAVADEDQLNMESPKTSFRWEAESSYSITSSVYSGISMASSTKNIDQMITSSSGNMLSSVSSISIHCTPRKGNWITTDSDFVVLEL